MGVSGFRSEPLPRRPARDGYSGWVLEPPKPQKASPQRGPHLCLGPNEEAQWPEDEGCDLEGGEKGLEA